jgi:hypothetical protein
VLQTARADSVITLLVFLNLLESQSERVRNLSLGHVEHEAPHAQASADMFVDRAHYFHGDFLSDYPNMMHVRSRKTSRRRVNRPAPG